MFDIITQRHDELSEKQLDDIAFLKDQHWPHGTESQKAWIIKNFEGNDIHIIMYQKDIPIAYTSLNHIKCIVDSEQKEVLGVGGVCVAKNSQKQGLGIKIIECANRYITAGQQTGLLLCHKELIGFYRRCGWETINCKEVIVAEAVFEHFAMGFGKSYGHVGTLVIQKNF